MFASGPGGSRTHSIPRSKREWSPGCRPGHRSRVTQAGIEPAWFPACAGLVCQLPAESREPRRSDLNRQLSGSEPDVLPLNYSGGVLCAAISSSSGRRIRTFTGSFKDCQPTISRSPRVSRGSRTRLAGLEDQDLAARSETLLPNQQRKGWELNPQALSGRPFSRRLPSPVGLPFRRHAQTITTTLSRTQGLVVPNNSEWVCSESLSVRFFNAKGVA